jgi:hypothetical protein
VPTKNCERLLQAEVAHKFLAELLNHKEVRGLLSDEHFSVDGTQVAAWASMKSFRAKDGSDEPPSGGRNGERDFHGETRSNDTHASTTDPDARLYRKGKGQRGQALLYRQSTDREPSRTSCRGRTRLGDWNYRTRGSRDDGSAPFAGIASSHARRRQGLRCTRVRRRFARPHRWASRKVAGGSGLRLR